MLCLQLLDKLLNMAPWCPWICNVYCGRRKKVFFFFFKKKIFLMFCKFKILIEPFIYLFIFLMPMLFFHIMDLLLLIVGIVAFYIFDVFPCFNGESVMTY